MIQEAIYSILVNNSTVNSLVSTRIYPLSVPQHGVMPCISYSLNDYEDDETFDGQSGLSRKELQIDCWADDYMDTLTLAAAVKAALQNYTGTLNDVTIQRLVIDTAVSVFEENIDLYRTSQSYTLNAS
jgi:hypothetical protein